MFLMPIFSVDRGSFPFYPQFPTSLTSPPFPSPPFPPTCIAPPQVGFLLQYVRSP